MSERDDRDERGYALGLIGFVAVYAAAFALAAQWRLDGLRAT